MINHGVRVPTEDLSPDGRVIILPPEMWSEQLRAVMAGELGGDRTEAAHLLAWEQEHFAIGPRRAAQGRYGTAVADCPNCITPKHGRKIYCELHRCRGVNANGERCRQPAREASGLTYCHAHGCQHQFGPRGVRCPEAAKPGGYCAAHHVPVTT